MTGSPAAEAMLAEGERRRLALAEERRGEFFASRTDIPDLEFLTPDCSICGLPTEYDDGQFTCIPCCTTWQRNGYGHEAFRWDDGG